jgi:hypothetical protein
MSANFAPTPDWADLSAEQKRQQRYNWFMHPEGLRFINAEAEKAYHARAQRLMDVYSVREPDRVPVSLYYGSLPFSTMGVEYREGIYDFEKTAQVYKQFNQKNAGDLDSFAIPAMVPPGNAFEILDYRMYVWPGHGLPGNATNYQFVEGEYMRADEYDDLILNPSDFWMRTYLPRIFGSLGGFRSLDSFTDIIEMPSGYLMSLTKPEVRNTWQKLLAAGEELQKRTAITAEFVKQGLESGYPIARGVLGKAPFDIIGDTLRGTQGIMKDMYRQPDKLLEAMEVMGKS